MQVTAVFPQHLARGNEARSQAFLQELNAGCPDSVLTLHHVCPPPAAAPATSLSQMSVLHGLEAWVSALPPTRQPPVPGLLSRCLCACLHLLESPATGPVLVPVLLQLLAACMRSDLAAAKAMAAASVEPAGHSRGGSSPFVAPSPIHVRFTDVVDLLVGWSLGEAVPTALR